MATYSADIDWKLADGEDFPKGRYSRGHTLTFDGGTVVPASASPHVVGKWAVKEAVDPEEMLVAAMANCHMLSFLHVARLAGFTVAAYHDHAEGVMEEIAPGKHAVTNVVLHPQIGEAPEQAKLDHLHHEAHEVCFIANSVKTKVTVLLGIRSVAHVVEISEHLLVQIWVVITGLKLAQQPDQAWQ
jgi:organic hydroperoxide reductase OsmC/OhrA